ncbi:MAG: HAD-IIIA family hydrolase [Eubacteriales bacterium]|nr:HAD-IIIA family hydrolase [Eubacteriales bacterium]
MIKCAIFDLDGTLVNTIEDLGYATDYVLEQYGKEKKWTMDDYRMFVGNGAKKLVERAFEHTLSPDELEKAYEMFKVRYQQVLLDHAHIYDGIKEQLDILKEKGIKIAVVTNKPHLSAVKMVETLFGKGYFDLITGAKDDTPRKPDPTTTKATLKALDCKASEAIFFGDSDVDIKTAKNAGIEAIACSWGFRSFESLLAQSPSAIIDEPKYISKLF